jgi:hypothetical protein
VPGLFSHAPVLPSCSPLPDSPTPRYSDKDLSPRLRVSASPCLRVLISTDRSSKSPPFGWIRRRRPVIRVVHVCFIPTFPGAEIYRFEAHADTAEARLVGISFDFGTTFVTPQIHCTVGIKRRLAEIGWHFFPPGMFDHETERLSDLAMKACLPSQGQTFIDGLLSPLIRIDVKVHKSKGGP